MKASELLFLYMLLLYYALEIGALIYMLAKNLYV